MSARLVLACAFAGVSLCAAVSPIAAQDVDIADIFSNRSFYEAHDLMQATGDVHFVADVWYLPGPADSTRALVGISLSNSSLQFRRTNDGRWEAAYGVTASVEPDGGAEPVEKSWQQSVSVESFDETLLTGETIVFQTDLTLAPGEYELSLTVRDRNADHGSRVSGALDVPSLPRAQLALSEPVLLRLYRPANQGTEYVVHPSHYYPTTPERIDFLAEASGVPLADAPYTMRVSLFPAGESETPVGPAWTGDLTPDSAGTLEAFGSLENPAAQFGEFELVLELTDSGGNVLASESTPVMIAGSSAWIAENWKDALRLIRYEATEDEMEILEEIVDPVARLDAWGCFWKIRDPVGTTATNEALVSYFQRVETANRTWHSAMRPGYLSDRGRVFITLGPPDDIIERPMPAGPVPFEIWRYYSYNVEIRFVDRIGFNNYELDNVGEYQSELSRIERRKLQFLRDRADECPLLAPAFD
ncbi:MAG TPA: GWxTD domain-containing protein [Gemmatimonadota bacterium]|nr:GWxTD domain-containing protein [Gemmatimonadota bacterium]